MRSGDKVSIGLLNDAAEKGALDEIKSSYQEIAPLKYRIANINEFASLDIEKAKLQEIVRLRNLENQKIIEGNRSFSDRLKEMSAQMPSMKTTLEEGYIKAIQNIGNVFSTAVSEWDGTAKGFFTSIVKGFTEMITQLISQLLALIAVAVIAGIITALTSGEFKDGFKMVMSGVGFGGGAPVAVIEAQDLRAHAFGETLPDYISEITYADEHTLPREYYISSMNPAIDYHNEPQEAQLFASTQAREIVEVNFPFVATPEQTKRVAETQLLKTHLESKAIPFSTLPKHMRIAPGDTVTLKLPTRDYNVKITKKRAALLGRIEFEGVPTNPFIYEQPQAKGTAAAAHSASSKYEALPAYPRNSKLVVIESEPLLREHVSELGVYLAASGRGGGRWDGTTIYREQSSNFYEPLTQIDAPAKIGVCQNVLATFAGTGTDALSNSTIYFYDAAELESVLLAEATANPALNLIRIGDEWVQYLTAAAAALPSGSIYRSAWTISNLLRGRFGTPGGAAHAENENAVLATSALKWRRFETAEIGRTVKLKAVTSGQAEEYAPPVSFVLQGKSIRAIIKSGDYQLTKFDDRKTFANLGSANFTLPEFIEGYSASFAVANTSRLTIHAGPNRRIYLGSQPTTIGGALLSVNPNPDVIDKKEGHFIKIKAIDGNWSAAAVTGAWFLS